MNPVVLIRIFIGFIFVVSSTEKLLSHYQNFLYVIQAYDIVPAPLDEWGARVFPWLELMLGVFTILGLWMIWVLRGLLISTAVFLFVVGQAVLRNLPIEKCGCFGELVSIPLPIVLLMDSILWICIAYLIIRMERASRCSLDEYFSKKIK